MSSLVMGGFPQPVSHDVVLSRVFPMLMPGLIWPAAVQASSSPIVSRAGAGLVGPRRPLFCC